MKYIELKELLKDFTVFSLNDIKRVDDSFYRSRLNEWQKKGYIKKIVKGYYIFSDLEISENVLYEIANRIYAPSYVSLEIALSYYNLIPESVYGITSVSTRKTYKFKTPIAEFSYRKIKPELFFGYELVTYNGKVYKIASIEKTILDYFYLNPHLNTKNDFVGIRIDKNSFFEQVKKERLFHFLKLFSQKSLTKRINLFWEFLKNA